MIRREDRTAFVMEAALAAPALLWLAAAAAILIASLMGYRALAAPPDLTLAEAAAIRDGAEVLRQIGAGADPNGGATIRRGILRDEEAVMTPLEAATAAGHEAIVQLLIRHGAELNETNFTMLLCLARENEADEIVSLLQEHAPSGVAPENCP